MTSMLLLGPRADDTSLALAPVAQRRGLEVRVLDGWRPSWGLARGHSPHIYAMPLYFDAIAQSFSVRALQPADGWLPGLPREAVGRDLELTTVAEARCVEGPVFVQPPLDRTFPARVYASGAQLPGPDAVHDDAPALVSSVVAFGDEFRFFLLDGEIRTGCRSAAAGRPEPAPLDAVPAATRGRVLGFLREVLEEHAATLPSAVVLDLGLIDGRPAVIGANPAWTAGHQACDLDAVLDVALRATGAHHAFAERDRPFLRPIRMASW